MLFPCIIAHNLQDKSFSQKKRRKPRRSAHAYRVLGENSVRAFRFGAQKERIHEMTENLRISPHGAERHHTQEKLVPRQSLLKQAHIGGGTADFRRIDAGRDDNRLLSAVVRLGRFLENIPAVNKKTADGERAENDKLREHIPKPEDFNRKIEKHRIKRYHSHRKREVLDHLPGSRRKTPVPECPELLQSEARTKRHDESNDRRGKIPYLQKFRQRKKKEKIDKRRRSAGDKVAHEFYSQ